MIHTYSQVSTFIQIYMRDWYLLSTCIYSLLLPLEHCQTAYFDFTTCIFAHAYLICRSTKKPLLAIIWTWLLKQVLSQHSLTHFHIVISFYTFAVAHNFSVILWQACTFHYSHSRAMFCETYSRIHEQAASKRRKRVWASRVFICCEAMHAENRLQASHPTPRRHCALISHIR